MEDFYSKATENKKGKKNLNEVGQADKQELEKTPNIDMQKFGNLLAPYKQQINTKLPDILNKRTNFEKKVEEAQVQFVKNGDGKHVEEFKKSMGEAILEEANVAKEKAIAKKEVIITEKQKALLDQKANKWANREIRRKYHYNGVKPIMQFVGICEPLNLFFLYLLTVVLFMPFLVDKLIRATFGALLTGANSDRPRAMKNTLWTIFVFAVVFFIALGILLVLEWLNITDVITF